MRVSEGMTAAVLSVGPHHTLRDASRLMAEKHVGAAVVNDPEQPGPGIITERDILFARQGRGPRHRARRLRPLGHPHARLARLVAERAAEVMVERGFRHLVVVNGADTVGVLSMRDIVRCWIGDGATSDMPRELSADA